jgi:hypothetical protein
MVKLRFPFRNGRKFERALKRTGVLVKSGSKVAGKGIAKGASKAGMSLAERIEASRERSREEKQIKKDIEREQKLSRIKELTLEKERLITARKKAKLQEKFNPKSKKKGNLGRSLEKFFTVE